MIGKDNRITKDFIFSQITQQQVFEKYLGISISDLLDGKIFCNPTRVDDSPTCTFKVYNNDLYKDKYIIWFRDWSDNRGYDCIGLVQKLANCSYYDALCLICHHFSLLSEKEKSDLKYVIEPSRILQISKENKRIEIRIKKRDWTLEDIKFWKQYNLIPEEDLLDVFPIKCYWLNGNKYYPRTITFCYDFGNYDYKIYSPYAQKGKEIKFLHNNTEIFQGQNNLKFNKDLLIITSSYKDVKVLRKIEDLYSIGYEVIAPMSEIILPKSILKLKDKYKNIILYHNNDKAGIESMIKQSKEYNLEYIHNPLNLPKDISDIVKEINFDMAVETIHNLLYQ